MMADIIEIMCQAYNKADNRKGVVSMGDKMKAALIAFMDTEFAGLAETTQATAEKLYSQIDILRAEKNELLEACKAMLTAFDSPNISTDELADTSAIKKTRLAIIKAAAMMEERTKYIMGDK